MWNAEKYVEYLIRYARKFNIWSAIRFKSRVTSVERLQGSSGWNLSVTGPEGLESHSFDYLVVCTGVHSTPSSPELPNSSCFTGKIIHGNDVNDPEDFRGKKVVLVGTGEYGSDLAYLIGRVSESLQVSVRRWVGYMIPRYHDHAPTDLDTSRLYHSLPKSPFRNLPARVLKWKRKTEFKLIHSAHDRAVQKKADELNQSCPAGVFQRTSSKSENLIRSLLESGVTLRPEITDLQGLKVSFQDGSECECDVIILCTGFRPEFPFLDDRLRFQAKNIRNMAYYMLPLQENNVAFVGFTRPGVGSIPPMAELQARYLALLLSRDRPFPDYHSRKRQAELQHAEDFRQFPLDAGRLSGLTDYHRFLTTMAKLTGCEPPVFRLFLRSPVLFFKVYCAFICPAQFRLYGPGSDFDNASRLIKSLPTVSLKILLTELLLQILSLPDRKFPGASVWKRVFRKIFHSRLKSTDGGVP